MNSGLLPKVSVPTMFISQKNRITNGHERATRREYRWAKFAHVIESNLNCMHSLTQSYLKRMQCLFIMKEFSFLKSKEGYLGDSLAVQWLRLGAFTAVAWVQFLVRELRHHKPQGVAKQRKKEGYLDFQGNSSISNKKHKNIVNSLIIQNKTQMKNRLQPHI